MIVPGIYIISGLSPDVPQLGNNAYFGLSVNPEKRLNDHQRLLKRNEHGNEMIQNFYNARGNDQFYYAIVEQCDVDKLAERERHHIALGNTYLNPKGFNLTAGGEGAGQRGGKFYSFEDQNNGLFITGQNLALFQRANPDFSLSSLYQLSLGQIDSYKNLVWKDWQL